MFHVTSITAQGEVLQTASTQHEDSLAGGKRAGAAEYIYSEAPENTYWDFLTKTWVPIPIQPDPEFVFDWVTKTWTDPRGLQQLKDAKWEQLKVAREEEKVSPLVTPYGILDADPQSQKNITDAIMMLQTLNSLKQPGTVNFTMHDNSVQVMDLTKMVTIGLTLGQRTQALQAKGTSLRAILDKATTKEQINAIIW